jgi:hypothetical protein
MKTLITVSLRPGSGAPKNTGEDPDDAHVALLCIILTKITAEIALMGQ